MIKLVDILKEIYKRRKGRLRSQRENTAPNHDGKSAPYGSGFIPVKELVTSTEVICDNCGWGWKIEDGGDQPYLCHKCGHDNANL
jgi:hypothetical protein